jgi:hypothetical protein
MTKFNKKTYIIIFMMLLVVQFLVVLLDAKTKSGISEITGIMITIFSIPINLINENLPFYVREPIYVRAIFWLINIFLQAFLIYMIWSSFKRVRKKMK